ncbi:hypothetical protein N3K64_04780 [Escherichia coli]|uniref:hypothetical protein n=1 Tax=Escherichia coli TaxID=562 RepID=UPI0021C20A25|nr:hypothetical protein [Escherichia coli]MCT9829205.1 hypothetical protein [Escherichia coli]
MSKELFDMKRLPVDRVAARVAGKGVDWTPNKVIQTGDSDLPLPICPTHDIKNLQQRREVESMIGRKRGRLTIIGLAAIQGSGKSGARYVVRCVCGTYTYRRSAPFKKNSDEFDGCERCRELLYLKRSEYFRRTGKDADWSQFM